MPFIRTTAINKLLGMTKRIRGVPGGTSASKTFGILAVLINTACTTPMLEISVVSESVPHLKRGAIKDFKKIMVDTRRWHDPHWNTTDSKYTFANGSYIEFFSADTPGKVHGPRRHILYINEGNRIKFETYHALAIRTSMHIWIDFNPTKKFWYHEHIVGDKDWEELVLNYKHNEALSEAIIREIEKGGSKGYYDPWGDLDDLDNIKSEFWANWWRVYGLGQLGKLEGQIFKNWKRVRKLPKVKHYAYGLDFGYTSDPTALVKGCRYKGELYAQELWYQTNYSSSEMIEYLYSVGVGPTDPIICDHDFTAVQDLRDHGFRALKVHKPKDSIISGIQSLQDIQVYLTYDSHNFIKEEENYFWDQKDGNILNVPVDEYNHCIDSLRYLYDYIKNPRKKHYLSQEKERRGGRRRVVYAGR
jgi:phage terminase large subunit